MFDIILPKSHAAQLREYEAKLMRQKRRKLKRARQQMNKLLDVKLFLEEADIALVPTIPSIQLFKINGGVFPVGAPTYFRSKTHPSKLREWWAERKKQLAMQQHIDIIAQ